jgi:hypothetical protein
MQNELGELPLIRSVVFFVAVFAGETDDVSSVWAFRQQRDRGSSINLSQREQGKEKAAEYVKPHLKHTGIELPSLIWKKAPFA